MRSARISVVIPIFNGERFVTQCIQSISKQTFTVFEIIVINDCSSDNTLATIDAIPCEYLSRYSLPKKSGAAAARNFGIQKSQGDYIAFLDADDLWHEAKLEKQMTFLRNSACDAVFSKIEQFNEPGMNLPKIVKAKRILPGLCASTMLIKKSKLDLVGMFDQSLIIGEFIDWYLRAQKLKLKMQVCDLVLAFRRVHGQNTTSKISDKKLYLKALAKHT